MAQWQAKGLDHAGAYANPGWANPAQGDFHATTTTTTQTTTTIQTTTVGVSLSVSGFTASTTAGVSSTITVFASDPSYNGTINFTSSDPRADLPADYTFTLADHGCHTFVVTLKTAGTQSIMATDVFTGQSAAQSDIKVSAASASAFAFVGLPTSSTAGAAMTFTLYAKDAFGNTVTNFTGLVHFTSSDALALLPADYAFTAANNGRHTFTVILRSPATQRLVVTAVVNSIMTGSGSVSLNASQST
jgi:hypothetical protein